MLNSVGPTELMLLFVIALLILGPERLPKVASQLGRWVGRARRTANHLRHQLEREIALNELHKPKPKPKPPEGATGENKIHASPEAPAADDGTAPESGGRPDNVTGPDGAAESHSGSDPHQDADASEESK
jgi:sec-independent protein translocase protein TatB